MRSGSESVVYVVDDDASLREAIVSLLRSVGTRAKCFSSAHEFLHQQRSSSSTPCCLLLDVRLPDWSGLELQRKLTAAGWSPPIIFMTAYGDVPTAVNAMKGGAIEFLPKPFNERALLDTISQALEQDSIASRQRAELHILRSRYDQLTVREREVMGMVVLGRLNKQIAAELHIAEITVKVHRHRIMKKMRAANFAQLIRMAERLG